MKYIDAEKLIADIKRLQRAAAITMEELQMDEPSERMRGELDAYDEILYFIDTLQQEQPEVDLEKEIDRVFFQKDCGSERLYHKEIVNIAHHFYELGQLEMRKRITNPEYNRKVIASMKEEHPADLFNARKEE